jgi:hypothetical protein
MEMDGMKRTTTRARALPAALLVLLVWTAATGAQRGDSPESPNAALRYWMAFALMQDPSSEAGTTELLASVEEGRAAWNEARLGPVLEANRQALEIMRRATRLARCDWGLEAELGPFTPIAHLARARVLARLNTLDGIRLSARGQSGAAADRWLAGLRFSQHVAEGGSLIALLTARVALRTSLDALTRAVQAGGLSAAERQAIQAAVAAIPETGFRWDAAIRNEQQALEVFAAQLARDPDPAQAYRRIAGAPLTGVALPGDADVAAFRQYMAGAADALRLPPQQTALALRPLDNERAALHPFYQIPSLTRVNETRAEVKSERDRLLRALAQAR